MTFGFPAYHTEHFETGADVDLRKAVRDAIRSLSWKVKEETASTVTVAFPIGLRSFGETLTVDFISPRSLSVTSRSSLPTQCFDWGKNKQNVQHFLAALADFVNDSK